MSIGEFFLKNAEDFRRKLLVSFSFLSLKVEHILGFTQNTSAEVYPEFLLQTSFAKRPLFCHPFPTPLLSKPWNRKPLAAHRALQELRLNAETAQRCTARLAEELLFSTEVPQQRRGGAGGWSSWLCLELR